MNTRLRFMIIATVVAACAAVGGLFFAGVIGSGGSPAAKVRAEPVRLTDPFIVNLADTDSVHYVKLGLAVQVADMPADDLKKFAGQPGAEGTGAPTGAGTLAVYPPVRDAVIDVVSQFTAARLNTQDGKAQLKSELLQAFTQVAQRDQHGKAAEHDVTKPPFKITDVYFLDFAVQ
jgi:flagellar basal body-associated protein FliL